MVKSQFYRVISHVWLNGEITVLATSLCNSFGEVLKVVKNEREFFSGRNPHYSPDFNRLKFAMFEVQRVRIEEPELDQLRNLGVREENITSIMFS